MVATPGGREGKKTETSRQEASTILECSIS
jgi:hypothetical protein